MGQESFGGSSQTIILPKDKALEFRNADTIIGGQAMNPSLRFSILAIFIAFMTGCFAGGGHPRRDAFSTIKNSHGVDLATRVARDQVLTETEISVLKDIAIGGDQNILFCLLSNRNLSISFQKDLIERANGWGLQGIGYNKTLYFDKGVKWTVSQKADRMSESIYELLWIDNKFGFPQDTPEYRNELGIKAAP